MIFHQKSKPQRNCTSLICPRKHLSPTPPYVHNNRENVLFQIVFSALLSLAVANPLMFSNLNGQILIPYFRQPYPYYQPQQYQYYQGVDRADHEPQHQQTYSAPDFSGGGYGSYDNHDNGNNIGHEDASSHQSSSSSHDFGDHQQQQQQPDYSAFTDFNSGAGGHEHDENFEGRHDEGGFEHQQHGGGQPHYVHSVPVSEHVEVTKPVAVPVYKEIGNSKGVLSISLPIERAFGRKWVGPSALIQGKRGMRGVGYRLVADG